MLVCNPRFAHISTGALRPPTAAGRTRASANRLSSLSVRFPAAIVRQARP